MIKGRFGTYNGDSWEQFCQQCLKIKYRDECYQELYASQGDLGIEGFTRTGKVFQCYCPDDEYDPKNLYEKQRTKINNDLNKLVNSDNVKLIKKYLFDHDILIKEWVFLSPIIRRKDMAEYCLSKRDEFRKKKLEYLSDDFEVIAYDEDIFTTEVASIKNANDEKLYISPNKDNLDSTRWKDQNIYLVDNAIRKNTKRLEGKTNIDVLVNDLTEKTIQDYFYRDNILKEWNKISPTQYEKFSKIIGDFESDVQELCMTTESTNETLFREVKKRLKEKIEANFSNLSEETIDKLTNGVTADWILRCPIDFY